VANRRSSVVADVVRTIAKKGPITIASMYKELHWINSKSLSASLTELTNRAEGIIIERDPDPKTGSYRYKILDELKGRDENEIVDLYYNERRPYVPKGRKVVTKANKPMQTPNEANHQKPKEKTKIEKVKLKDLDSMNIEVKELEAKSGTEMLISKLLEGHGVQVKGSFDLSFRILD